MNKEKCLSPVKKKCLSENIVVYILLSDGRIPICRECWKKICKLDLEWNEKKSLKDLREEVLRLRKKL